jgi:RND family efflux transporter MFP subunit
MQRFLSGLKNIWASFLSFCRKIWRQYLSLPGWGRLVTAVVVIVVILGALILIHSGGTQADTNTPRTVTLASVSSLSGGGNGVDVLGTVRSVTEAEVIAQSSGEVKSLNAKVGQNVGAGYVIASLDNAAQSAAVLQAQGGYDAAVAARNATRLQSGNAATSFAEAQTSARNTYRSAYTSADVVLNSDISSLFGGSTAVGPDLLISDPIDRDALMRERRDLNGMMDTWRQSLATSDNADPEQLLNTAQANLTRISTFLTALGRAVNDQGSGASATQVAGLATARAANDALLAAVSAARDAYRAKKTAAQVAQTQSNSTNTDIASADASVTSALGSLRAAQAAYEKTIIRAPIGGTVNFLSLHKGDYVSALTHVATVARNNALEVVAYLSEDDRNRIAVGDTLTIEGTYKGVVTSVAPALDPTTKQTEVHIAITDGATLVDGQAVHIQLPDVNAIEKPGQVATSTPAQPTSILLPLAAVKLRSDDRVVFTVDKDGVLVAHKVEIGDVVGDKIQILSGLTPDMQIVADARGLSEGEKVTVEPNKK